MQSPRSTSLIRTSRAPAVLALGLAVSLGLGGCATPPPPRTTTAHQQINAELDEAAANRVAPARQQAVEAALLPPLSIQMPRPSQVPEQRFNLAVNNAPAEQIFLSIVSGTRYSMLVHPEVTGRISINLQNVTVFEALDAIRENYGYDYRVDGTRIFVQPLTLQTRVFKLNYIAGSRQGSSDIRVTSGSVTDTPSTTVVPGAVTSTTDGGGGQAFETSRITTTTDTDFWSDLQRTLIAIIGDKDGNNVVVNAQSGVVLVRARASEIRQIENYLRAVQLSVNRQVMLEAKIIEVQLSEGFQTGINWAAFNRAGRTRFAVGANPATINFPGGTSVTGSTLGSVLGAGTSGLLNIAAMSDNFAALMNFLDTQGTVHVLSSPRIATMNNQKAVLKVGTDEFFVTNISSTTTALGTSGAVSTPNVTLRPFFSGIALDVTPQISEDGQITLHIHPAVTQVVEKTKVVELGASQGPLSLPLASSTVSETDSIVRVQDGSIVAIGGLMRQSYSDEGSHVPGVGEIPAFGELFRHRNRSSQKRELVILLKTTVVEGGDDWAEDILQTRERIQRMQRGTQ